MGFWFSIKFALLKVISRRAQGPTRGQILLNGVPMSMRLFQESCGYVTQKCDLLEGLSVEATLMYAASISLGRKVSSYVKTARVKQVCSILYIMCWSHWRCLGARGPCPYQPGQPQCGNAHQG